MQASDVEFWTMIGALVAGAAAVVAVLVVILEFRRTKKWREQDREEAKHLAGFDAPTAEPDPKVVEALKKSSRWLK
ncbi:MAG: hypothetical protein Kow00122_13920 [Thermoleophilia bacterium]